MRHIKPPTIICYIILHRFPFSQVFVSKVTWQRILQSAVASSTTLCVTCIRLLWSSVVNSCAQTAADNWQWRHFHGYSFTCCVFISSGQASMERPLWIKLLLWSLWPCRQLSAAPPCFLPPQQVHIKGRTTKKWEMEFSESGQLWGIALKTCSSWSFRIQLKLSRTHLSTVRTWLVYIMHSTLNSGWGAPQTISQFLAVTWLTGTLGMDPRKKKPDCCHTKLQTFPHYAMNQVGVGIQRHNHLNGNKNVCEKCLSPVD